MTILWADSVLDLLYQDFDPDDWGGPGWYVVDPMDPFDAGPFGTEEVAKRAASDFEEEGEA